MTQSIITHNLIAQIVVGVANLDRALKLWTETFGLEVIARRAGADHDLARMWELQPECITNQAVLATPGVNTGHLHLVEFADPLPPVRLNAAPTDSVPKNIDLALRDLPARYEELLQSGHTFRSKWVQYQAGGLDVLEVQMPVHDEINISMIEILGKAYPFTAQGFAGMTNFVPVVPDGEVEMKFYHEVLGLPVIHTHLIAGPEIEKMIGLPPGAALDIRILGNPDDPFGHVELVCYKGAAGTNRYPLARPPATGSLHLVFLTSSMPALVERVRNAGVAVQEYGEVNTILGRSAACSVVTPAGMRLDIHEPRSSSQ